MRAMSLVVLAPVLLSGCALLSPALGPPPSGGVEHDGYLLFCEGVPTDSCEQQADDAVRFFASGDVAYAVRWVTIRPHDEFEICWDSPRGSGCDAGSVLSTVP
jgi:hypothetical protein